ncbi:MAG TPA: tetratricopeptide repeat protein [Bacteroidia bacterium]|nr:tetratricopeptide repeat protein [Bacteroidia bacterium]
MKTSIKILNLIVALCLSSQLCAQTLQEAIRFTDNEQYDRAKATYLKLLAAEPTNGDIYFYFGDLLLKLEDVDSAGVLFQKGVNINPTNPLTHVGLARYYMAAGKTQEGQKEIVYARSLVTTQAGKKGTDIPGPRQGQIQLEIAKTLITGHDYTGAVDATFAAERQDPKNPEVFLVRGDAQMRIDVTNASEPIANYKKAAALDPNSSRAWVRIGMIYAGTMNMPLAISYYNKALSIQPDFGPAYRFRGEAQYRIGKFDSAVMSYKMYLDLNNNCYSRYRYAAFLYISNDYEGAIREGESVLACDSSITVVYRIVGRSYLDKKVPEAPKAVTYFNLFFAKQKQYGKPQLTPEDYLNLGRAYSKNQQDSLAVAEFKKAQEADTSRKDIYTDFATAFFKMKKYDSAAVYYKKKLDASPKPTLNDYYALGQAYFYAKNYPLADSAFRHVTEMDPKNPAGWLWRAKTNYYLDPELKFDSTRTYYETYFDIAVLDKEKNKKDLIAAAKYLAGYHFIRKNYGCSKAYFLFVQELDPANEAVKKELEGKELKAAAASDLAACKLIATGTGSN